MAAYISNVSVDVYMSHCSGGEQCEHGNRDFKIIYELKFFMFRRSAGSLQEHVRPNSNLDVVSDVTGVNVCIFGVFDLQPGRAAPKSALQGPSGTFAGWFLPSRCRVEFFHLQHF